ncbi:MAG: DUF962 domain-containing protein, partial [Xanthomonadales bacterium]|nr:DUF962 domain-containing protein [Xanthomonadales bacterium]
MQIESARAQAFTSFAEFYPFYLGEHQNLTCRRLHFAGSWRHMWACRMSADMNHLTEDDLYEGVEAIISASD